MFDNPTCVFYRQKVLFQLSLIEKGSIYDGFIIIVSLHNGEWSLILRQYRINATIRIIQQVPSKNCG